MEIELIPKLLKGRIVQITGMGVKIELKGRMGVLTLPMRSVFTDKEPALDDQVELYISYARVVE